MLIFPVQHNQKLQIFITTFVMVYKRTRIKHMKYKSILKDNFPQMYTKILRKSADNRHKPCFTRSLLTSDISRCYPKALPNPTVFLERWHYVVPSQRYFFPEPSSLFSLDCLLRRAIRKVNINIYKYALKQALNKYICCL